jgi:hypothetical protein
MGSNPRNRIGQKARYTMSDTKGETVTVPVTVTGFKKGAGGNNYKVEADDGIEISRKWVRNLEFEDNQ